ncbi:MAG: RHS repeat-associated core domain-containing protein, partial [Planctomycetota bacterium]|nr:RHS repeat-associated core domain-containing protein [Planctomycetota bacterium]
MWDVRYIDAPVLRWHDANEDGDFLDTDETLYYTNDANMNVTALVATDGDVVERYSCDPYGQVLVLNGEDGIDPDTTPGGEDEEWTEDTNGSDVANTVLFAGYRFDAETGLYHVRHRVYHATLGRWVQRDPIGYSDSPSLYQYVVATPVNARDPSGLRVVGSVECPGGEWYMVGTKTGGQAGPVGYDSYLVTLTCKQRRHVQTEVWCIANTHRIER